MEFYVYVLKIFDDEDTINTKVETLVDMLLNSKYVCVHTGAGISTASGIPDFRGKKGVWTLEQQGIKPQIDISFTDAVPTKTHMALKVTNINIIQKYSSKTVFKSNCSCSWKKVISAIL